MLEGEVETGEQVGSFLLIPGLGIFWPQCMGGNLFKSSLSFFLLFGFRFFQSVCEMVTYKSVQIFVAINVN